VQKKGGEIVPRHRTQKKMNDLTDERVERLLELNEKSDVFIEGRDLDQNRRECVAARQIYRFFDHAFDDVHFSHLLSKFLNCLTLAVIPLGCSST
jgi:hypothetical protein